MLSGLRLDVKAMRAQTRVGQAQREASVRPGSDFGTAPGSRPGLEVWRVENFQVVAVPPSDHGKFYTGDSYIALHTKAKRGNPSALQRDLFFWLGQHTSQDEAAVAAYKSVELDDRLGGEPTQHREVQGHESQGFRAAFPRITYLEGGVSSGLKSARDRDGPSEPRLLHCTCAKTLVARREPQARRLTCP